MATLQDITSADWSLSLTEQGEVVQGLEDIAQCIFIILTTERGSDPLRPTFGCGIYQRIDQPINTVIAEMVRDIVEAINLWEPRVEIVSITPRIEGVENPVFTIVWRTAYSDNQTLILNL